MIPNKEKVIKELEDIQKHLETGYSFAISWKSELIRDALALLKERETVVRCGDCENFCFDNIFSSNVGHCMLTNKNHSKTWFCAHGKREEGR